jgi:type II secretory pathway component GspD/PulD (secretin)
MLSLRSRCNSAWISTALTCVCCVSAVSAEEIPVGKSGIVASASESPATDAAASLRFSFEQAPWRDVINWIADEADLALHVGELPTGSFTYVDPNAFSHEQALDRINLFLLPQGFTLVRSGKLLSVINLSDPRSKQQLDAIAELIPAEALDQRSDHEVVKCILPLGEISADAAVEELAVLKLMSTPDVLTRTNQLMITDTVRKLKSVKSVLDAFQTTEMANGTIVKSFALQHVDAEDVLLVARPHLGLATGEMIGIDVSLSADLQGKNIFVTGVEDKVKLLEGLVTAIDQPEKSSESTDGEAVLRSHRVEGGNVEVVYSVLQTLLAGKTVRMSMDERAGSVVALASEQVQQEIAQTVTQLQASEEEFAVIQLKTIDPYLAVSLLEEMLDLDELESRASASTSSSSRSRDPRSRDYNPKPEIVDIPKIDADPGNMRLFVRAKPYQLEQIRKIVEELDANSSAGSSDVIRIFPLRGKSALQVLLTAAKFWRADNPIILYASPEESVPEQTERVVTEERGDPDRQSLPSEQSTPSEPELTLAQSMGAELLVSVTDSDSTNARLLTNNPDSQEPAIRCQLTSRGLLLHSEDVDALNLFENHLRTIAGPVDAMPSAPIVFYLKYTKAEDALRMLAELMDGGQMVEDAFGGTLVNGYVSSLDSLFGSFVTSSDGTTTMTSGSITVVADTRLNRLIAQGTAADVERIENYLEIIDKDRSLTEIETHGTSHVIELYNTKASEVATAIRDAYAGRVAGSSATGQPNQQGSPQQAKGGREAAAAKGEEAERGDSKKQTAKKPTSPAKRSLEPMMTIAVHERSNSLIVTAPDPLFQEVQALAKSIDARGEQTVEVVTPVNGAVFETVLQQLLLGEESATRSPNSPTPSPPSFSPPSRNQPRGKGGR